MKNKKVSLLEIVKIQNNEALSEKYIRYLCGLKEEHQYRHDEVKAISVLINALKLDDECAKGFIYGYEIPQLNKEFDLLKITSDKCLNIEIKAKSVTRDKIKKQLTKNAHFLRILDRDLILIAFDAEKNEFFRLLKDGSLEEIDLEITTSLICSIGNAVDLDLDSVFKPSNILVSPLNEPDKFFKKQYLLTENQESIKNKILLYLKEEEEQRFFGLTGGPGTGKTLLLYDIAFDIARSGKSVLVVHSGIMCKGHEELDKKLDTIKIVWAKSLRYRQVKGYDVVVVDESQRIYIPIIDNIKKWVNKAKKKCIFSFDESQKMSKSENRRDTPTIIRNLCTENYLFRLTNKIRTNKEIALFITCLRDISKYRKEYHFENVSILFESNKLRAVEIAKDSEKDGYKYISYTSSYYNDCLDYQSSESNTHRVIGQEFDGVVMILSNKFYYENNLLNADQHPNSDYLYTQLLYQGLTRTRAKLRLIIQTEELLEKILILFGANETNKKLVNE